MRFNALLATVALIAAASASTPVLASDHGPDHDRDRDRDHRHTATSRAPDSPLQTVPNTASPGQRAYGWRYFSDPTSERAVVISPQGDYYLSRGDGLRWVAAAPTGA